MKPSEFIERLTSLEDGAQHHDTEALRFEDLANINRESARRLRRNRAELLAMLDKGESILAATQRFSEMCENPQADTPAVAPVNKDGTPRQKPGRKPKAHVEPVKSPLTDELRGRLFATLGNRAMKASDIQAYAWATGLDVEGLLCEDPSMFLSWTDDKGSILYGLAAAFDKAVASLILQCSKEDRAKYTAAALNCSIGAARDAWARLDPSS